MARLPLDNRAGATLRLQAERTLAGLQARLREEWTRFAGDANVATRRVLHEVRAWERGRLARMQAGRLLSRLGDDTTYQRSVVHPDTQIRSPTAQP